MTDGPQQDEFDPTDPHVPPHDTVATIPEGDVPESDLPDQLVLRLDRKVVRALRDVFIAVADGKHVTIVEG